MLVSGRLAPRISFRVCGPFPFLEPSMTDRSVRRAIERKAKKLERKRLQNALPSEACLEANRANAQLSTGPRSENGKAKSSLNAVKTALTGSTVLLPADDTAE